MAVEVGVKVKSEKSLNKSFEVFGLDDVAGAGVEKKSFPGAGAGVEKKSFTGAGAAGVSDEPKKSNSAGFAAVGAGAGFEDPPKSAKASEDFVFEDESEKGSKLETWLGRRSSFGVAATATGFFSVGFGASAFLETEVSTGSKRVGLF